VGGVDVYDDEAGGGDGDVDGDDIDMDETEADEDDTSSVMNQLDWDDLVYFQQSNSAPNSAPNSTQLTPSNQRLAMDADKLTLPSSVPTAHSFVPNNASMLSKNATSSASSLRKTSPPQTTQQLPTHVTKHPSPPSASSSLTLSTGLPPRHIVVPTQQPVLTSLIMSNATPRVPAATMSAPSRRPQSVFAAVTAATSSSVSSTLSSAARIHLSNPAAAMLAQPRKMR